MRKFCLLIIIILWGGKSFAQVNLPTGSAVFSLPIFNWHDDKGPLSTAIALNYNSGNGLKVNDIASNVGQGWNLSAGGVITRMQVGEPDDQPAYEGNGTDQDVTKYPAGFLYHSVDPTTGCPGTLTTYPTYGGKNVLYAQKNATAEDKEHDYFTFQFNGQYGMFIIDTTGGPHGIPLGDTKLKIAFQEDLNLKSSGIRTTITSFTITDINGVIYKFAYHGLTKLLRSNFSNEDGSRITAQPTIKNNGVYCQSAFDLGPNSYPWKNQSMAYPYIISNWYLSEIDDPFTSRKITFNYNTLNLSVPAGQDITYNKSTNNYVVVSYKKSITTTLEISSINYPDGHLVNFNYSNSPRADYPGEYALSNITIQYSGRYLSEYQLETTYFILNRYGNPSTPYQNSVARLCLKSLKKISADLKEDSPPYQFDYYTGSSAGDDFVPPPFFYAKDIWGYYNGNNSIASNSPVSGSTIPVSLTASVPYYLGFASLKGLCFQNDNVSGTYYNAKPGYAENGLLKQIIYPTGGTLKYDYAQNTGSFTGNSNVMNVGGVHVSQTESTDGGYSNGCANPVITKYDYVMNGVGSASSLWGLETPINSVSSNNSWKEERRTWHWSWSNPFGTCLWHYVYPGILSQYEAVSLDSWQKFMVAVAPVLGVLSVISTIDDIVNVIASTGFLTVAAVIIDVITTVLGYILSCPQQSKYTQNTIFYDFDLNQAAPLPAQFKRVEVTESSGSNGKIVHLFTHGDANASTDPQYYALWSGPGSNTAFSSKQRFAPWAYGLPYLTTVYDANGQKIKETQNNYNFSYAMRKILDPIYGVLCYTHYSPVPVVSCKCQVVNNYSLRSDYWTSATPAYFTQSNADMNVDIYNYYSGRLELSSTIERTFRVGDPTKFTQNETDYSYNNADCDVLTNYNGQTNYEVSSISTILSNGDDIIKDFRYTTDFNSGIFLTMSQKNIVSTPVSTITRLMKNGNYTNFYLNEKVTEFTQASNGEIKPSRVLEQRFGAPQTSFTQYSGPSTTDYSKYKITSTFTYDANSNLVGMRDEGNRTLANIYDYNDKNVVASVINADPLVDKPAYTSFETTGLGGWGLTGTGASYTTASFITGSRGFVLNNNTLSASLNTAKPYILSFWASNSSVTVNGGATLSKSGPSYLGMTYYEYNITQGTSSVSVSGNSNIDELRVYPKTARMKTNTYDPLIGKTSECDENNRITYYSYDNLDRLQFIKDENGNVVKEYEYNNVSAAKQTGCTSSYSNNLISEIFTRSNCGTGYQGGNVIFTIPAGAYTSSISQQDADMKAEMYLLANAQNYADANGSCSLIYYNTQQSKTDTTQICNIGYKGGVVTYIVAPKVYSSIISQADADQKALDDINANAQYSTNLQQYLSSCVVDTAADYEGEDNAPTQCQQSNGFNTGHQLILVTDINPNSPTYNHTQWVDKGVNTSTCPAPSVYVKLSYENTVYAGAYEYQDIVARFYSDAQCTIPFSVSNLDVFYHYITYDEYGGELNEHDNDTYCTGNTYVLVHQAVTYYSLGAGNYEYTEYYVDPDPTGYYAPIQ
jgi:hypothetical protein